MKTTCLFKYLVFFLILGNSRLLLAHSMYQAAVLLDYHGHSIDAELQLPPSRLETVLGRKIDAGNLSAMRPMVESYIRQRLHVYSPSGAIWTVQFERPLTLETLDDAPYISAHLLLSPPIDTSVRTLTLDDEVIADQIPGQATLVSVRSDWNSSTFANEPELLGALSGQERSIQIDRNAGNWIAGFRSIFHLGVRHIAEGTDHLLFLLALLLPAPLLCHRGRWATFAGIRRGFTQILKVVTAFTIGHSITLALAASGLLHVPSRPIEVLIAVSILISAIHAIRPIFPGRESFIAAAFGLIHGLAFASTLADLGLRGWDRAGSIFSFNLGIEAMQLVVVLCVMPSLMLLSRTWLYPQFRSIGAALAGVAACGWIVNRALTLTLPVDIVVDVLSRHSLALMLSLFLTAAITTGLAETFGPRKGNW